MKMRGRVSCWKTGPGSRKKEVTSIYTHFGGRVLTFRGAAERLKEAEKIGRSISLAAERNCRKLRREGREIWKRKEGRPTIL